MITLRRPTATSDTAADLADASHEWTTAASAREHAYNQYAAAADALADNPTRPRVIDYRAARNRYTAAQEREERAIHRYRKAYSTHYQTPSHPSAIGAPTRAEDA